MKFWQYQSYVVKKTGKKGERWIPVDQFDKYRTDAIMRSELSSAQADFRKSQKKISTKDLGRLGFAMYGIK